MLCTKHLFFMFAACLIPLLGGSASAGRLVRETVTLKEGGPEATICLAYRTKTVDKHPVILMLGGLEKDKLPDWSTDLVDKGYMLAAFVVAHPPDPDPNRRPVWLYFDQRFAHGYVLGGKRAPGDAARVIDYLVSRKDVHPQKIGWLGSSSTGIPGLSVACHEPRLAAIVAFVSTGAYKEWLETWIPNGLWRAEDKQLWPETLEILKEHDPILHVKGLFPKAVLMVSGGDDKVVDPKTAKSFVDAARPYYATDPERLRLVIYEGFGHNLPRDIIKMYAEHFFRLYMHPTNPPPAPPEELKNLQQSVTKTQINSADHKDITGAK